MKINVDRLALFVSESQKNRIYCTETMNLLKTNHTLDFVLSYRHISAAVRRAGISRLLGSHNSINVQGEEQQKLDVVANKIFIDFLR